MPAQETAPARESLTNWMSFEKAGLAIAQITCDGYKPIHAADFSCHSKLPPKVENILSHIHADHGGGFLVKLEKAVKASPIWKELRNLGVELLDFRCDVCGSQVRIHPQYILSHLRSHSGKTRKVMPGGRFNATLTFERPLMAEEDETGA